MKVKTKFVFVSVVAIALTGCATKAPDCNDSKTKDLVISIEHEPLKQVFDDGWEYMKKGLESTAKSFGVKVEFNDNFSDLKLSVENVRMTGYDEKIGKYSCSGSLVATAGVEKAEVPIDFTSELADGGGKQYVQATKLSTEDLGGLLAALVSKKG